jgi:hypothetical protein
MSRDDETPWPPPDARRALWVWLEFCLWHIQECREGSESSPVDLERCLEPFWTDGEDLAIPFLPTSHAPGERRALLLALLRTLERDPDLDLEALMKEVQREGPQEPQ